jgi:DNA-binding LacI/PurR family transcriptional regulator
VVNLFDVARHAGVSISTVSRVLSGGAAVAVETRERVMQSVRELAYRPNTIAQSLRRGRGRTVALVTGDIEQGIYAALAKEVQIALGEVDLDLMLFDMAHSEERLSHLLERSVSLGLRGLLLASPHVMQMEDLRSLVQASLEAGVFTVSVSQRLDGHGIPSIVPDDVAGAEAAVRHLVERGREPLAFLGRIATSAVGRLRFEGYCRALDAAGRKLDHALVWDIAHGYRSEAGYSAVSDALKKGLCLGGVLAASDELALGGMAAALDLGRRTPEDIAFVGFGGLQWGRYTRPALTTVSLDVKALAAAVGQTFNALAEDEEVPLLTLIPPNLVLRGSS